MDSGLATQRDRVKTLPVVLSQSTVVPIHGDRANAASSVDMDLTGCTASDMARNTQPKTKEWNNGNW